MTVSDETREDRVVAALKQYMELLGEGDAPSQDEFLRLHREIADELRPSLEGLMLVHRAGDSSLSHSPHPATILSPVEEIGGKPIGDFQLVREIGRGGMGVVYEATQLSLNRRVALKVLPLASGLDEVRLQRFRNEANAAATLHHTNIVPVYAVGSDRGVHFYAMQLIDGITLSDLLRNMRSDEKGPRVTDGQADRHGTPSEESSVIPWCDRETAAKYTTELGSSVSRRSDHFRGVVRMIRQAALAIDHAHQYGVVHRDVKPANLLLDTTGKLWVADFGLAQFQAEQSSLTRTGDPIGTLRYMSPEQATGRRAELDHRTDIYSLGVTLYELLTLQPAIADGDLPEMLKRVAFVEPPTPRSIVPSLPLELDTIVRKAIAKMPSERYESAGDLADDLQAWLDDKPIAARPPSLLERLAKWRRRNSGFVAATSVILLLATIGLAITTLVVWSQQRQTSAALERETEQRMLAEKRFDLARRAVDTFSLQSESELSHRGSSQDLRRSFLETSLTFYQDLLSERAVDSQISSNLLVTRDRIQQMVRELQILDNLEALRQVREERVQVEIGLSQSDSAQVLEAIEQFEQSRAALGDQFIAGLQGENHDMSALLDEFDKSTRQRLTAQQLERLRQVSRQRRLPLTFKNSEIIRALNLTSEQVERIDQIIEETVPELSRHRRGGPDRRTGGGRGDEHRPGRYSGLPRDLETLAAKEYAVRLILDVLTTRQREAWDVLVGDPLSW